MTFWIGFGIGIIIGFFGAIFIIGLCMAAKEDRNDTY